MLTRFLSAFGFEKRSAFSRDDGPVIPMNWTRDGFAMPGVTPRSVLSNFAVAARCVALRSELLASVPLKLYRRLPNGDRERVSDTPLADVLGDLATPLHTAYELREFLTRSLDLHGNAYARIERDSAGQVTALWPLEPQRVTVERLENGRLRYRYSGERGPVVMLQEETLHIRSSSEDSLVGRSPLTIARGSFELGLALNEAAHSQAANGFKPAGIIMHPGKLTDTAKNNIRQGVEKHAGGASNTGRPAVFEEGMKWQSLSWSATDAQLLESRAMTAADICHAFNLSPSILGLQESVSYGSAQQAAQDLITNALAPLASRVEQAMQRCLLSAEARRTYVIEHDLAAILRSEPVAQMTQFRTAREAGIMSANECRRMLNMSAIPGGSGDDYTPLRAGPQQAEPPIATVKP